MESPTIFWIRYFILATTVFGISSMLLYGSIFEHFRQLWFKYAGFLADLGRCQLCISMWLALGLQWQIMEYVDPFMYFYLSASVAGISWLLGATTQANLWKKAYYEKWYNKRLK